MAGKTAPTNWDHEAHLALLQAIVYKAPPTGGQWDEVLAEVGKKGYVYTASAAMYISPFPFAPFSRRPWPCSSTYK